MLNVNLNELGDSADPGVQLLPENDFYINASFGAVYYLDKTSVGVAVRSFRSTAFDAISNDQEEFNPMASLLMTAKTELRMGYNLNLNPF